MTLPPTCQLCVDVELTENTAGPYIILPTSLQAEYGERLYLVARPHLVQAIGL